MKKMRRTGPTLALTAAGLLVLAPVVMAQDDSQAAAPPPMSANASVYATGLDSPRGLEFGPDGMLYVAEAGQGGTDSTDGQCDQVVPPVGPYTSGETSRISKLDESGARTTVVEGLPSAMSSPDTGGDIVGASDVAFLDGTLYYTMAGAGCSHGVADVPNGVFRVEADGTTTLVADTSAFDHDNPVAKPNPGDFEPDGEPYSLVAVDGQFYLVEPNQGAVDRVDPATGAVTRVIDISASQGHVVPTAIALGPDGVFRVGNLATFPVTAGNADIYDITTDGQISIESTGLTAVLGVAYDQDGRLYALETSAPPPADAQFPVVPFSGRVVRVADSGLETVATGLDFPTGMTMGPDGNLYISDLGFASAPGAGQIVKVDLSMPIPEGAS